MFIPDSTYAACGAVWTLYILGGDMADHIVGAHPGNPEMTDEGNLCP